MNYENLSILIIDDDDLFRQYLSTILKNTFGINPDIAKDPKEAFILFNKIKPSLIILDMEMPIMDGFTFLREIRSRENLKEIPVIVCSVIMQRELIEKIAKWNISDYILKTVSSQQMTKRIKKVLDNI